MVQSEEDGAALGVIVVGKVMPSVAADIGMRTIIAVLTFAGVLIFLIALWVSSVIAREITDPVRKLVAGTQEVAAGNLECQVNIEASDEIGMIIRPTQFKFITVNASCRDTDNTICTAPHPGAIFLFTRPK